MCNQWENYVVVTSIDILKHHAMNFMSSMLYISKDMGIKINDSLIQNDNINQQDALFTFDIDYIFNI